MNLAQGKKMRVISQDVLKEFLHYNPETGIFTWIKKTGRNGKIGKIAGSKEKNGYMRIQIHGIHYGLHRLAWLYMTGEMPTELIDHKNGNPSDNWFDNLRQATLLQNQQNQTKVQKSNKLGIMGVNYQEDRKKFRAQIRVDGKSKFLGRFDTAQEAATAYLEAKRKYHEFCTI